MRQTVALVNLSKLKQNYLNIRKKVSPSGVMAVVKANAYGHGVGRVIRALQSLQEPPEYYAVATAEEAAYICDNFPTPLKILVFEPFSPDSYDELLIYKYSATITDFSQALWLQSATANMPPYNVHIKVDTGMGRLGIPYQDAFAAVSEIALMRNLRIEGIYTHFATSDEADPAYAQLQLQRFTALLNSLKSAHIRYGVAHAANSGAIHTMPNACFDLVRPGISLYGYVPSLEIPDTVGISPVLSLESMVETVRRMKAGESVSYGRKFILQVDSNIFTVPVGYADGFSRGLSNKALALVNGKIYPQVGRVTMDRVMFNAGDEEVKPGDTVVLLGSDGAHAIDAWDWSRELGTIPYEITCGLSRRVPRVAVE